MSKAAHVNSTPKTSLKTLALILLVIAAVGAAASFVLLQRQQSSSSEASVSPDVACINKTGTVVCKFEVTSDVPVTYSMRITYTEQSENGTTSTQFTTLEQSQLLIKAISDTQKVIEGSAQVPLKAAYSCDITVIPVESDPACPVDPVSANQTIACTYDVNEPTRIPIPTSTPLPEGGTPIMVETTPGIGEPSVTSVPGETLDDPLGTGTPAVSDAPIAPPGEPTYTLAPTSATQPENVTPTDTLIADGKGGPISTTVPTLTSEPTSSDATPTDIEKLPTAGVAHLSFIILFAGLIVIVLGFVI